MCRICGDRGGLERVLLELGRRGRYRSLVELATAGGWQGAELAGLLAAALDAADPEVRGGALRLLETSPHPAPAVVSRVVRALTDPDGTVRWLAARTLEASGDRGPEVVAALQVATGDTNAMVQTVARRTLGRLAALPAGPDAPSR
ncbi:MAG: HEAT repeat domain-containing protein [Verrucomicrobia bacterium]|nr:HEAT repeat domain-containing protein [Verrucomicrobiota bacterium]